MHIAIVEDNQAVRQQIESCLHRFSEETGEKLTLSVFEDGLDIVEKYEPKFDLILLDIQMKKMDGMQAAERIREKDEAVLLVFLTHMDNYAVKGYAVGALDFILKPVNYLILKKVLQRALNILEKRSRKTTAFSTQKGLVRLYVEDIRYVEAQRHQLRIHTGSEDYFVHDTMQNLEKMLEPYDFYRCHSGFLINLMHVDRADKTTVVVDGEELLVARPRQKEFMARLMEYLGK